MNDSYDLKQRILYFRGRHIFLCYLASLSNDTLISRLVEGLEQRQGRDLYNCIHMGDVEVVNTNDIEKIQYALMSGNSAIIDGEKTYIMDTKNYPNRAIQEPETEKSVRGSKDGFNESILNNTGLIRRRIKTPGLCFHREIIGTYNQMDIAVVYIEDKVENEIVNEKHYQRTFSVAQYKEWLVKAGFTDINCFSDFEEYKEECERIIFVCTKGVNA